MSRLRRLIGWRISGTASLDGEVWLFDRVHASPVIAREDHTFGFALFEYTDDFDSFQSNR